MRDNTVCSIGRRRRRVVTYPVIVTWSVDYRSTRRPGHLVAYDGWSTRRHIENSIGQLVAKCRRIDWNCMIYDLCVWK